MAKVIKEAEMVGISIVDSLKQYTLNYTDIIANSNKTYSIEVIKASDNNHYLYSIYGRVGGTLQHEYRLFSSQSEAESEAEKIVKSKTKKGYQSISLVKKDIGSEQGKAKTTASVLSAKDATKLGFKVPATSSLHPAIQNLVKSWFGSIEQFVIDTLDTSKCALGQLSLEQISKGRDLLLEARKLVAAGAKDISELNSISSKYYSNIPMNFGYRRLNADQLRFDNDTKLDTAFDILDTLEGAKDAERILTPRSGIDEKYKSLKTPIYWVDPKEGVWQWIDCLVHKTRASNHHFLGKIKVHNIYRLERNTEYEEYMAMIEKIAGQEHIRKELPSLLKPIWSKRVKEEKRYEDIYDKANVLPLFHGTRTPNFPKILSTKLKMREPGFTVAGAMYDNGKALYFGHSSKSISYSSADGSYWSGGSDKKGYMFLSDVILGKQKIAERAYPYSLEGIKPHMSVWAQGGKSGVINDEFVVYTEKQNWLRYIVEFETKYNG